MSGNLILFSVTSKGWVWCSNPLNVTRLVKSDGVLPTNFLPVLYTGDLPPLGDALHFIWSRAALTPHTSVHLRAHITQLIL